MIDRVMKINQKVGMAIGFKQLSCIVNARFYINVLDLLIGAD